MTCIIIALITRTLTGQRIDHASTGLLKWLVPYVLQAYVQVKVYGYENCFVRAVPSSLLQLTQTLGSLKAFGFV